jgi:hypothetical protein
MKSIPWVVLALAGSLLAFAGCKKAEQPAESSPEYNGVRVDWPKLDMVFTNVSPELQGGVSLVRHAFRYGQLSQAIAELDKLASNPKLTEPQRTLVNDLLAQTKQAIAKAPPP